MADCVAQNAATIALMEVSRREVDGKKKEVEEKKKLLNEAIFNIDGLSEDEALVEYNSCKRMKMNTTCLGLA